MSGSFLGCACGTTLDVSERAPEGWKRSHPDSVISDGDERISFPEDEVEVGVLAYKQAWARLLAKVYEIDPLICPKCGGEMKVIAVVENPDEIIRILRHPGCRAEQEAKLPTRLVKIGRSPPGLDLAQLN